MFNKKLKEKIDSLKKRCNYLDKEIEELRDRLSLLENPYKFDIGQTVYFKNSKEKYIVIKREFKNFQVMTFGNLQTFGGENYKYYNLLKENELHEGIIEEHLTDEEPTDKQIKEYNQN